MAYWGQKRISISDDRLHSWKTDMLSARKINPKQLILLQNMSNFCVK